MFEGKNVVKRNMSVSNGTHRALVTLVFPEAENLKTMFVLNYKITQ
jgi:hypothetical protein